ncbi:hypothetical protein C5142_20380 [Rhodococcus sp. BGS-1C]|uniref:hypothetical protein n=1 Tax=unclassified Rhodococcus (in: high G+C Gram-positive bacteria) TaxID=192944 RepID=UPI0019D2BB1C|nr:hypothetical protein [Rhodococcus sp. KRD197]
MQSSAQFRGTPPKGRRDRGEGRTVHVQHGVTRELLMIGLVVAMGVLAAAAILLPAVVTA